MIWDPREVTLAALVEEEETLAEEGTLEEEILAISVGTQVAATSRCTLLCLRNCLLIEISPIKKRKEIVSTN